MRALRTLGAIVAAGLLAALAPTAAHAAGSSPTGSRMIGALEWTYEPGTSTSMLSYTYTATATVRSFTSGDASALRARYGHLRSFFTVPAADTSGPIIPVGSELCVTLNATSTAPPNTVMPVGPVTLEPCTGAENQTFTRGIALRFPTVADWRRQDLAGKVRYGYFATIGGTPYTLSPPLTSTGELADQPFQTMSVSAWSKSCQPNFACFSADQRNELTRSAPQPVTVTDAATEIPDSSTSYQVAGTGAPGATVDLTLGGNTLGSATVGTDGRWSVSYDGPLDFTGPTAVLTARQNAQGVFTRDTRTLTVVRAMPVPLVENPLPTALLAGALVFVLVRRSPTRRQR